MLDMCESIFIGVMDKKDTTSTCFLSDICDVVQKTPLSEITSDFRPPANLAGLKPRHLTTSSVDAYTPPDA